MTDFPIPFESRITTTIRFSNIVLRNNNNSEQRVIQWQYPVRSYSISKSILSTQELIDLRTFFNTIKGSYGQFYFNDVSDNSATENPTILNQSTFTWGQLYPNPDGEITTFQVVKCYQINASIHYRPIISLSNLVLVQDAIEITTGFTNNNDGTITFDAAPSGNPIDCSFDFKVPVRLVSDILEDKIITRTKDNYKVYALDNLEFQEIKPALTIYPKDVINQNLDHTIQIDLRWNQQSKTEYKTEIRTLGSGQESRKQRKASPEYFADLQPRNNILLGEMQYLIALWLNTKGNGLYFNYIDAPSDISYLSRFDNDELTYINQSSNNIFEVSGLSVKMFKDGIILDDAHCYSTIDAETYIIFLADSSGSMDATLPSIQTAITQLKPILRDLYYEGDQAKADKYIKDLVLFGHERYLLALSQEYRDSTDEAIKYTIFLFENEADNAGISGVGYHEVPRFSGGATEPTSLYLSDFNNLFLPAYNNSTNFYAKIIVPTTQPTPAVHELAFNQHVLDVITGQNGYTPLSNYNISGEYYFPISANPDEYLSLFTRTLAGVKFPSRTNDSVLSYALIVKITTTNNTIYAFTSHDKDLIIDGVTYKANGAINPTAYQSSSSLSLDSIEFDSVFIEFDEADLFSGKFRDATLETGIVNWLNLPATIDDSIDYQKGLIGQITSNGNYYTFEFLSKAASKLNQNYVNKTTSVCQWVFGDNNCGYNPSSFDSTVHGLIGDSARIIINTPNDGNYDSANFRFGIIQFISGELTGQQYSITKIEDGANGESYVYISNYLLKLPSLDDEITIKEGCDRTYQACANYNNLDNYGAIPTGGNWMPGSYYYINPPKTS